MRVVAAFVRSSSAVRLARRALCLLIQALQSFHLGKFFAGEATFQQQFERLPRLRVLLEQRDSFKRDVILTLNLNPIGWRVNRVGAEPLHFLAGFKMQFFHGQEQFIEILLIWRAEIAEVRPNTCTFDPA